jgi:hypothetical protein
VLWAFSPWYGASFLLGHGVIGLLTLGAVFLVVTGSEALYADLGHFGGGPIRFAWLTVALPALTINYLGRAEGAGHCAPARLDLRHHVDLVLSIPALAAAGRPFGHAALAGPPVHHAHPDRQ